MSFGFGFGFPKADTAAAGGVPGGGASLRLNFLDSTTLDPRVTFSRTSNATVFDNAGNLVYAPHNLLTFSESLDNSAWSRFNGSFVAANTAVAPDGTTTADAVTLPITAGIFQSANGVPNTTYVFSVYIRASTPATVRLVINTNLSDPALQTVLVTTEWQRFSVAKTTAAGTTTVNVQLDSGNNGTFFVWGAQLNVANAPGVNLLTFSEQFDNAAWTKFNTSIQSNLTTYSQEFDNAAWSKSNSFIQTNQIRNNTMQGAVAGTPGTLPTNWIQTVLGAGLTANVVGVGTSSGINYVDVRVFGTPADVNGWAVSTDANTQIAASSGQVWTGSAYIAIVGGSSANIPSGFARVTERNSGGGYVAESNVSWTSATSVLANNRFSATRTLGATAAFVQFAVYFGTTIGAAIDITIRIGWPQLVLGAVAGDPVPTYNSARAVQYTAPDGSITADKLSEDISAATTHRVGPAASIAMAAGSMFFSVYLKAGERTTAAVNLFNATDGERGVNVDLVAGTITSVSGTVPTRTITAVGDGWYRVAIGVTATVAANTTPLVYINLYGNYTGDGTSGIYVWGAQLVQGSEPYDYIRTDATPVAIGYSAPDATMTADAVIESSDVSAQFHTVSRSGVPVSPGTIYTLSTYVKAGSRSFFEISPTAGAGVNFNLTTGTINFTYGAGITGVITAVGGGWFRISASVLMSTATTTITLLSGGAGGSTSYIGNGSISTYLWGAQLNVGATALPYVETTNNIYPVPSYNDTTVRNLLGFTQEFDNAAWTKTNSFIQTNLLTFSEQIDNAAWGKSASYIQTNLLTYSQDIDNAVWTKSGSSIQTNLLTYSQQFDNAAWAKSASYIQTNLLLQSENLFENGTGGVNWIWPAGVVTGDTQIAPNGTLTADTITSSGAAQSVYQSIAVTASTSYTFSVFVKLGTMPVADYKIAVYNNTAANFIAVDVVPTQVPNTSSWTRISYTFTTPVGCTSVRVYPFRNGAPITSSTVFVYGAQLVQGAVPGDYQQTLGTAAAVQYLAPDASITADKLGEDTSTGAHNVVQTATIADNTVATMSVYIKPDGRSWVAVSVADKAGVNNRVWFNVTTGVQGTTTGTVTAFSANPMGGGWYRISVSASVGTGGFSPGTRISLGSADNTPSYTGDGTSGILIWGAQLVLGAAAGTYQETVASALPIPYTAPDGSRTSEKLVEDTATSDHRINQASLSLSAGANTYSAYAKAGERSVVRLQIDGTVGGAASSVVLDVDLVTGVAAAPVAVNNITSPSALVSAVGDGWYRIQLTFTLTAASTVTARVFILQSVGGASSYTGNGSSGLLVWGAQLVQGAVPGDYQVTYGATSAVGYLTPDSSFTAEKFVADTTTVEHYGDQSFSVVAGNTYTVSAYFKAGGLTDIGLRFIVGALWTGGASPLVRFNLLDGTASTLSGSPSASSIQPVGNGWYRCSMSAVCVGSGTSGARIQLLSSTNTVFAGNGTDGILVWGLQTVQGSVPGDYQQTVATALPVQYVAPDGSVTGDKLVETTAASATHLTQQTFTSVSGAIYTASVYVKAGERGEFALQLVGGFTGTQVRVNLLTGAVINTSGSPISSGAVSVGNGWYRVYLSQIATSTASSTYVSYISVGGTTVYTGDGTSGIYIWGAQLSDSASLDPYVYNPVAAPTAAAYYGPRFDYDPFTLAPLGLLIEEQRTNSIRNNSMVGAVAGTPGTLPTNWVQATLSSGLTQQVVGVGTDGGINYIDIRLFGTTADANGYSLNFEAATQIAAANGQSWTASLYLAIVSGSTANITSIAQRLTERSAAGAFLAATDVSITATSSLKNRFFTTRTFNNASTAFTTSALVLNIASGVAIDITLRIGLPQLELGAFATSVIPTTTAAATRTADLVSMVGANFSNWYNQSEGTMSVNMRTYITYTVSSQFPFLFQIDDGTSNNRIYMLVRVLAPYSDSSYIVVAGGATQALFDTNENDALLPKAVAYRTNDFAFVVGGELEATDPLGAVPVVNRICIGSQSLATNPLGGYVRSITYFPRRLANAELQGVTL